MKRLLSPVLLAVALIAPLPASAAQFKAFVAPFVVAPQEAAGLKDVLQRLLTTRVAGDGISTVNSAAEADVVVSASYTQIGKMFSVDATAKLPSGQTLASAFDQGESQDELIPAVGRISAKLKAEMLKQYQIAPAAPAAPAAAPSAPAVPPVAAAPAAVTAPQPRTEPGSTVWLSQRIRGAQSAMALAGTLSGSRAVLLCEGQKLQLYRQDKTLTLAAETAVPQREKVVALDATGSAEDGTLRAYLTIVDQDTASSRIYTYQNGSFKLVAKELPYMFRRVALDGGAGKVYAQQMGRSEDFYGPVFEVSYSGENLEVKNPMKLPGYANIFNFNRFKDAAGKRYYVAFSNDSNLVVYSEAGEELWRSPDKFGGSETFFERENRDAVRSSDDAIRWRFLDQRITVTDNGDILVPQNDGFFVLGNQRSYSKHAFASLTWNGSSLEEKWKTKTTPNYLADYFFVPASGELVLLEVVQKEGLFTSGGSTVRIIRGE